MTVMYLHAFLFVLLTYFLFFDLQEQSSQENKDVVSTSHSLHLYIHQVAQAQHQMNVYVAQQCLVGPLVTFRKSEM